MRLLRRLYYLVRLRRIEADVVEEIEFHRSKMQRELEDSGLSHEEARVEGARAMGNMMIAREEARGVWLWPGLESLLQDLRYAIRNLRRQPGFTLVAVGTLVVGIGLNTSLFTVFGAVALRPWAVMNADRVVNIYSVPARSPGGGSNAIGFSIAEARFINAQTRSFTGIVATRQTDVRFSSEDGAKAATAMVVSGNYFRVLGVDMARGRGFLQEEDTVGKPQPVAILSYLSWQNRFGSDPEIIGKQIRLDNVPFTVVGVAARDFSGTASLRTEVWIPLAALPILRPLDTSVRDVLNKPDFCCASLAGRLNAGMTREQARAELEVVSRSFHTQHSILPNTILLTDTAILSNPGSKGKIALAFVLMFVAVVLVLLLACANVGNLLLARAAQRQHEIATRLSLGASRARLIRQLLTESLVLACAAGCLGVAVAYVLPPYVLRQVMSDPMNLRLQPDLAVLTFSVALSVIACVVFGLAPALQATRLSVSDAMKGRALGSRLVLRNILLSIQVAVSVVLLVSATLMIRGVQRAQTLNPGFPVNSVTVVSFDLAANSYTPARVKALVTNLLQALTSLPASKPCGLARSAPFANGHWFSSFHLPGEDVARERLVESQEIAGGYFDVLGTPIVAGRGLTPSDDTRRVVVVNEAMARRYFADSSPIGKTIVIGKEESREVVGVVKDAYTTGLDSIDPLIFEPVSGREMPQLLIRDATPGFLQAIEASARRLDPRIQVRVEPLAAQLDRYLSPTLTSAALAGMLGTLALSLATVGIFGVFSYVVRQRTPEIGLRMALGAKPRQIVGLVLAASSRSIFAGVVVGFVISAVASRLMRGLLYGLSGLDPLAYAVVCLILSAAAITATWVPARRAILIDPLRALKYE